MALTPSGGDEVLVPGQADDEVRITQHGALPLRQGQAVNGAVRVAGLFGERQAELDLELAVVHLERHDGPLVPADASRPEIASVDDRGNAETHRSGFVLEGCFDVAEDHIGDFADGVEHLLVDGGEFLHQQQAGDAAGGGGLAAEDARAGPFAGEADERDDALLRARSRSIDKGGAGLEFGAQHHAEDLNGGVADHGDELVVMHAQ